jgi:hypothetical protein
MMFSSVMLRVAQFLSQMRECMRLMHEQDVDGGIQQIPEHNPLVPMAVVVDL